MQGIHPQISIRAKPDGYRIFLSGCGGTGKSHVVRLVQRDMSYLLQHVLCPDPDQLGLSWLQLLLAQQLIT